MDKEQLLQLAGEITCHLDGRWGIELSTEYSYPTVELKSADDTRWTITLRSGGYRNEGRLHIWASLGHLNEHLNRDEQKPDITVSESREPDNIARAINRRVIAHLKPLTEIAEARWRDDNQRKEALEAMCQVLSTASGDRLIERKNGNSESSYRREMFCPTATHKETDIDAEVFADGVKLTLSNLPIELAERVVGLCRVAQDAQQQ